MSICASVRLKHFGENLIISALNQDKCINFLVKISSIQLFCPSVRFLDWLILKYEKIKKKRRKTSEVHSKFKEILSNPPK